ncbi:MAG: sulfite exporter TauE/SafE family protein [Desulfomonilaceae bacterium]
MTQVELVIVGAAAVAGGVVNALAGGGTLITFPMLIAVGIPAVAANITNTVALCPGYLGGTLAQLRDLSGSKQKLYLFGPVGALGGVVGGILLLNTGEATFRTLVPYLILLAAGLLLIEAPVRKWHARRAGPSGGQHGHDVWKVFPVFLASIYGGYFGGGLSVIVLAILALVSQESLTRLNALKQVIALCVNLAVAIFFLFSGKVVWSATVVMAVGALGGGAIGGLVAGWVRPAVLRGIVVVFGVVISIVYFIR